METPALHTPMRIAALAVLLVGLARTLEARLNAKEGGAEPLVPAQRTYVVYPEQLGVQHKLLPGDFSPPAPDEPAAAGAPPEPEPLLGNLHVFLRGVTNDTHLLIRGFAYFDAVHEPLLFMDSKLATPTDLTRWAPHVYASPVPHTAAAAANGSLELPGGAGSGGNVSFTAMPAADFCKPLAVEGALLNAVARGYELHMGQLRRSFPLDAVLHSATQQPTAGSTPPRVYSVIGQWFHNRTSLGSRLLRAHVDVHRRLGFAGTLLYSHPSFLKPLEQAPVLAKLLRGGALTLVHWSYLPHVSGRHTYDQAVAHNHALLSLWQRNSYVFLADVDVMLALPQPGNVAALLGGCLGGAQNKLREFTMLCASCLQQDQHGEESAWEQHTSWSLLPLQQYSLRSAAFQGVKSLVNPDRMLQYFIHDGNVLDREQDATLVADEHSCAFAVHLRNVFKRHVGGSEAVSLVEAAEWLWFLDYEHGVGAEPGAARNAEQYATRAAAQAAGQAGGALDGGVNARQGRPAGWTESLGIE